MTDIPIPPGGASGITPDPSPRSDAEIEKLHDLHVLIVDTITGFDKIIEKAEPDFLEIAQAFRGVHVTQAAQVADMLAAMGAPLDQDGSVFGLVNKTVITVRSWFDDIGHNILGAIADGENRVIATIEDTIKVSPSPERRGMLEQMRGEIKKLLNRYAPQD